MAGGAEGVAREGIWRGKGAVLWSEGNWSRGQHHVQEGICLLRSWTLMRGGRQGVSGEEPSSGLPSPSPAPGLRRDGRTRAGVSRGVL